MNKHKPKSAFTIIEVVLVLAIAGLIFLMVFIALPALQRGQRDTQRKRQVSVLHDAYQRCLSLNRGKCRSGTETAREFYDRLVNTYIPDKNDITDPSTGEIMTMYQGSYLDIIGELAIQHLKIGEIGFDWSAGCQSDGLFDDPSDGKINATAAFVIKLESGGIYCVSNYNK